MDTPKIVTQAPDSVWLSWVAARIPAYATQTRINYVLEMRVSDWLEVQIEGGMGKGFNYFCNTKYPYM